MLKFLNNLLDQWESKWSLYLLLSGQAVMTVVGAYTASITTWAESWGPFGWLIAGLFCAAIASIILIFLAKFMQIRSVRELNMKRAQDRTNVNILQDRFEKEKIKISDIWNPLHYNIVGKDFRNCRFEGPMVIAFGDNVMINTPLISDCNFVVIDEGYVRGAVTFSNCHFRECEFDLVTFLLPKNLALQMQEEAKPTGHKIPFLGAPLNDHT